MTGHVGQQLDAVGVHKHHLLLAHWQLLEEEKFQAYPGRKEVGLMGHADAGVRLEGVEEFPGVRTEEDFTVRQDGLWGVYRFKRGFGGDLKRTDGPWDRVYNPALYLLYSLRTRLAGE